MPRINIFDWFYGIWNRREILGGAGKRLPYAQHIPENESGLIVDAGVPAVWEQVRELAKLYEAGNPYLMRYLNYTAMLSLGGGGYRPNFSEPEVDMRWDEYVCTYSGTETMTQFQRQLSDTYELTGELIVEDLGDGVALRNSLDLWNLDGTDKIRRDQRNRALIYPFPEGEVLAEWVTMYANCPPGKLRGYPPIFGAARWMRALHTLDMQMTLHGIVAAADSNSAIALSEKALASYFSPADDAKGMRSAIITARRISADRRRVLTMQDMELVNGQPNTGNANEYEAIRNAALENIAAVCNMPKETLRADFSNAVFASLRAAYNENKAAVDRKRYNIKMAMASPCRDFVISLPYRFQAEARRNIRESWSVPIFPSIQESQTANLIDKLRNNPGGPLISQATAARLAGLDYTYEQIQIARESDLSEFTGGNNDDNI